jgi:hypothetical protein
MTAAAGLSTRGSPEMWETQADLDRLKHTLDSSRERMQSGMLGHVFEPERSLSAEQLVALFPSRRVAALARATAAGEPRVSPVDVLLVRGRFHVATPGSALRVRHLRRRPAASLTYFDGDDAGVIAHGRVAVLEPGVPEFEFLRVAGQPRPGSRAAKRRHNLHVERRARKLKAAKRAFGGAAA